MGESEAARVVWACETTRFVVRWLDEALSAPLALLTSVVRSVRVEASLTKAKTSKKERAIKCSSLNFTCDHQILRLGGTDREKENARPYTSNRQTRHRGGKMLKGGMHIDRSVIQHFLMNLTELPLRQMHICRLQQRAQRHVQRRIHEAQGMLPRTQPPCLAHLHTKTHCRRRIRHGDEYMAACIA